MTAKKSARKAAKRRAKKRTHAPLPRLPDIQYTVPDVFILESLRREDELEDRAEGATLARLLRMAGKSPKYHYFEDERELPLLIHLFRQSQYRYLHFSSHGSPSEVHLQNDSLSYPRFSEYFKGHLQLRRVFFSCCSLGSELFSEVLAGNNKGMHSIVAPAEPVTFASAATMFQALYVSLFELEAQTMRHEEIRKRLVALRDLFSVKIHFSSYRAAPQNTWQHEIV